MPEFFGPLTHVSLAGALWLIPLLPLVAALVHVAIGASRLIAPKAPTKIEAKDDRGRIANVAILAMLLSFLATAFHLQKLLDLPEGERALLQHVWRMARFGQLDVNLDLLFDPLSAVMCLVITGVGGLVMTYAARSLEQQQHEASYWRFFAWTSFLVFAMLLLVLADNVVAMFLGWGGASIAVWALVGFRRDASTGRAAMKSFLVSRLGDAGFVLGAALLFWGLGGSWGDSDYIPDLSPRFASVAVGPARVPGDRTAQAPSLKVDQRGAVEKIESDDKHRVIPPTSGKGMLTLTSHAGAIVFMDDSRTPLLDGDEPLRSPFVRFPVTGGIHSFRIHPGGGLDDYLVAHVALGGEREVSLAVFGATLSFTQIRDQLAVSDAKGATAQHDAFFTRRAWHGIPLVTLVLLLFFFGAACKSAQIPLHVWALATTSAPLPATALIQSVTMGTTGVYVLVRLGFLFALSSTASAIVACAGAATALYAAVVAMHQTDLRRVLTYSTISQLGLMVLAVGVGAYEFAIFQLVTHAIAKSCVLLAAGSAIDALSAAKGSDADDASDLRNMGGLKTPMPTTSRAFFLGAVALTAAPIPGLAGFFSQNDVLFAAFTTENVGKVPGFFLFAVALAACALASFAIWRGYYLAFDGRAHDAAPTAKVKEGGPAITRILWTLAALSALTGIALGASSGFFLGTGAGNAAAIETWLASGAGATFTRVGSPVELALLAVSFGAATAAWSVARKRYGADRPADWLAKDAAVTLLSPRASATAENDAKTDDAAVSMAMRLRLLMAGTDTWVLDALVSAAALLVRAAAWVSGVLDEKIVDGPLHVAATAALKISEKLRARARAPSPGDDE